MDYENITGFLSCDSGCKWWVEHVSSKSEEAGKMRMMFLHFAGAVLSYTYPTRLDILQVLNQDILVEVDIYC
jgi:hypothetical protein